MLLYLCFVVNGASRLCVGGLVIINKKFVWVLLTITLVLDYGSYRILPNNSKTIKYKMKFLKR